MSAVVEAVALGRWYGQVVGLNELTVRMEPGITGLLGPNGAGKSTFLGLIAGELKPSRGTIRVLGEDPFANGLLFRRVGYCPQRDAVYGRMSGREMVRFLLRLGGYGRREADARARRALERVALGEDMERRTAGYSKGMRQRVKIAQAIAHDPELLVLDEPLGGLDPVGRRDVIRLLAELAAAGTSVLVSSHVLHEIEALTAEILLVHRGRLLAQGTIADVRELLRQHPRRVEIVARDARRLARALLDAEEVIAVRLLDDGTRLSLETRDVARFHRRLTEIAAGGGFGVQGLESVDASLEAVFDYLVA
ncbi:MAG: ABC transporter ATP-binding protein [Planctomycetota bacterium]